MHFLRTPGGVLYTLWHQPCGINPLACTALWHQPCGTTPVACTALWRRPCAASILPSTGAVQRLQEAAQDAKDEEAERVQAAADLQALSEQCTLAAEHMATIEELEMASTSRPATPQPTEGCASHTSPLRLHYVSIASHRLT